MNQQLQIFNHPEFGKVRVIEIDGEPYFVGTDVAIALGYANPQKALRDHVPDKFKRTERIVHPQGGAQDSIVISEAGMYKLVFKSKLPNAGKFSDWTCEEVLPSIRKTGVYVNEKITGDFVIALGMRLKEIEAQNSLLTTQVAELQPKASYYDIVLQCRDLVSWRKKRDLGERRNRFMWRLKEAMHDEYGNKRVSVAAIINATGYHGRHSVHGNAANICRDVNHLLKWLMCLKLALTGYSERRFNHGEQFTGKLHYDTVFAH